MKIIDDADLDDEKYIFSLSKFSNCNSAEENSTLSIKKALWKFHRAFLKN